MAFNLQNKVIFNYFPYPWFVSSIHVVVGTLYCALLYFLGLKAASFERVRGGPCGEALSWPRGHVGFSPLPGGLM